MPYTVRLINSLGHAINMPVKSIEKGQRVAVEHGACVYSITDSLGEVKFEVTHKLSR